MYGPAKMIRETTPSPMKMSRNGEVPTPDEAVNEAPTGERNGSTGTTRVAGSFPAAARSSAAETEADAAASSLAVFGAEPAFRVEVDDAPDDDAALDFVVARPLEASTVSAVDFVVDAVLEGFE